MTYAQACLKWRRVGASNATGLPLLAMTIEVLTGVHAINGQMTYDSAVRRGLTARQVREMPVAELAFLQFQD